MKMATNTNVRLVEDHYNKKNATDLDTRAKSPIFYLRNFNNWIKSVLINEYIKKIRFESKIDNIAVVDLGAGRGGDILKWKKANVSKVTFLDLAEKSLDECQNRYNNPVRCNFDAQFIHSDATRDLIRNKIHESDLKHNMVSSQFCIHYSFESFKQADCFLENVSDSLEIGGYFIGTTTDSNELISRLKKSETNEFGNELYNIKFQLDEKTKNKTDFPLFGVKFDFQLDSVVECPEYLLNFPALVKLAKRHNLELVFNEKFSDFFNKYSQVPEYQKLISIMKAMEPYYSSNLNKSEDITEETRQKEYEYISGLMEGDPEFKNIENNEVYVTLSNSEWEAINLYQCFAFVKVDENKKENEEKLEASSDNEVKCETSCDNEEKFEAPNDTEEK